MRRSVLSEKLMQKTKNKDFLSTCFKSCVSIDLCQGSITSTKYSWIKSSANFKFCRFKLCQFEPAWCFLEMQKMARRPPCVPCLEITSDIARESDSQTRDKMVCFDLHTTEPAWAFTAPGVSPSGPGAGSSCSSSGSQIPIFCLHFDLGECLTVWRLSLQTPVWSPLSWQSRDRF